MVRQILRAVSQFQKGSAGQQRSLRAIAAELARLGHLGPSGKPYGPESVKRMLAS